MFATWVLGDVLSGSLFVYLLSSYLVWHAGRGRGPISVRCQGTISYIASIMLACEKGLNFTLDPILLSYRLPTEGLHGNHFRNTVKACTYIYTCIHMPTQVSMSKVLQSESWSRSFKVCWKVSIVGSAPSCSNNYHSGKSLRFFLKSSVLERSVITYNHASETEFVRSFAGDRC